MVEAPFSLFYLQLPEEVFLLCLLVGFLFLLPWASDEFQQPPGCMRAILQLVHHLWNDNYVDWVITQCHWNLLLLKQLCHVLSLYRTHFDVSLKWKPVSVPRCGFLRPSVGQPLTFSSPACHASFCFLIAASKPGKLHSHTSISFSISDLWIECSLFFQVI